MPSDAPVTTNDEQAPTRHGQPTDSAVIRGKQGGGEECSGTQLLTCPCAVLCSELPKLFNRVDYGCLMSID